MQYSISVLYADMSYQEYTMEVTSLDRVLFSLIAGRSGIVTDNVLNMSITLSRGE
jgi:hypothetical protein